MGCVVPKTRWVVHTTSSKIATPSCTSLSELLVSREIARAFEEARALVRDYIPVARRTLGTDHELTFELRTNSARAIYRDTNSSRDVHEAVAILEDVFRTTRRVFGLQHPIFAEYRHD